MYKFARRIDLVGNAMTHVWTL